MSKLNPFHRDLAQKLAKAWLNGNQTDRLAKAVERALRQPNNEAIFSAAIDRVADHDENVREFFWAILDHAAHRIIEVGGKTYIASLFGLNLSGDREQICEFASEANLDKLSQIIARSDLVADGSSCTVLPGLIPDVNAIATWPSTLSQILDAALSTVEHGFDTRTMQAAIHKAYRVDPDIFAALPSADDIGNYMLVGVRIRPIESEPDHLDSDKPAEDEFEDDTDHEAAIDAAFDSFQDPADALIGERYIEITSPAEIEIARQHLVTQHLTFAAEVSLFDLNLEVPETYDLAYTCVAENPDSPGDYLFHLAMVHEGQLLSHRAIPHIVYDFAQCGVEACLDSDFTEVIQHTCKHCFDLAVDAAERGEGASPEPGTPATIH